MTPAEQLARSRLSRRALLGGAAGVALLHGLPARAMMDEPFSQEALIEHARDLASREYTPRAQVPDAWLNLTYDQYRDIQFVPSNAVWAGEERSYEVDFFPPGLYYPRPIDVYSVENGRPTPIPFNLDLFRIGQLAADQIKPDETLGFSGVRLRTALEPAQPKTEFCVFQGASYFRAIGIGQTYGLSGRGLAINTADPVGEEFPDFTTFWLEAPGPDQKNMVVHALMESPSLTGAYRFEIQPGTDCVMDVQASLFPRVDLDHVGLGPLTSMFKFDQTNRDRFDDFRPAVHDSDGLMMWNGNGEIIWRPLANPLRLQISSFVDENPRGFGLMQRARKLSDYADLEALYHNRPGLWVAPNGDWGPGTVTLVEIPTDKEIYDNIVAYWRPAERIPAGKRFDLSYRLSWGAEAPIASDLPKVVNTSMGRVLFGEGRLVVIDFEAAAIFDDGPESIDVHIRSPHVETSQGVLQRNPETGGLRLAFSFDPGERDHVELRAQLRKDGAMASEVWLYRWTA